ncbi:glycoside hydrolase family 9 protein [Sphingomonas gellani]|nr:glycoside hydrolase family 9 protein [Sphingomonas gellani]
MAALATLLLGATDEPAASPIRFDQVGFEADGPKRFAIETTAPVDWTLRTEAGDAVANGSAKPVPDAGSDQSVATVTIDRHLAPGRYTLAANGVVSRPIIVAERPFAALFRDAMSFFYQQRAGIPILAAHVQRPDLARPAGHSHEVATCFTGTDTLGVVWPGCNAKVDVTGGWYDAGDRGKYVVNAGISVWTLLNAYERAHGGALMHDGVLALPEAGNAVPDLLDEARYEIDWMLRMQIPAGTRVAVLAADGRGTRMIEGGGLAWHKVADTHWAALPLRVEDDHATRALYPPSTAATLNLAAVAAQAARIWRTIDPAFARRCLDAAIRAYAAAAREPALFADARFTGSGGYGDRTVADEAYWAAAELAITTGDANAVAALSQSPFGARGAPGAIGWGDTATLGAISLLSVRSNVPADLIAVQRRALLAGADRLLADDAAQPYRFPAASGDTQWGSNGALLDRAVLLGTAYDLTGRVEYRTAVTDALDYVLGRNPLDRSYVSGYGVRPMRNPHHRFWGHGIDPSFPLPPPGVLSGGPNSVAMTDPVAAAMKGRCRPLTCWSDDARAFTQNEVAINWNAPLVWVAAFLDDTRGRR